MNTIPQLDLEQHCRDIALRAREASVVMARTPGSDRIRWLRSVAQELRNGRDHLLSANQRDLLAAPQYGLTPAATDRLRLDEKRIEAMAVGVEQVANLPDPVGRVIESTTRPNGLRIDKVRSPLGVVFFIYESRPNVTADAAAICAMAGNAVILRGGKEAQHSSRAIVDVVNRCAVAEGLPEHAVQLVDTTDRDAVGHFLKMDNLIDVAIPRGGEGLVRRVVAEATMPVIKHFEGNCHVYVDDMADLAMATQIVLNGKCQRMGVCNATESLLVHVGVAEQFLANVAPKLIEQGIELRGCPRTCKLVAAAGPATEEDYRREYLGPQLSVAVVDDLATAIEHINRYGSHHTDAIVTNSLAASERFAKEVDSAAVMINASTRFNDGGEFGLGAEIGISTDKFHARGPCGIEEIMSYKYVVHGQGQIRQ